MVARDVHVLSMSERGMKVRQVMTPDPVCCRAGDTLEDAARHLWDADCGLVPVVDDELRLIGVVTDRDVLMAAHVRGETLGDIPVSAATTRRVSACKPDDSLAWALSLMRSERVRRLPVIDADSRVRGIVTLTDLGMRGVTAAEVGRALQSIVASSGRARAAE